MAEFACDRPNPAFTEVIVPRGLSALFLIATAFLLGGCPPAPDVVICDEAGCISESAFAAAIENALKGNVVGYIVIVGSQPPRFGGQARTPTDSPSTAMFPDLTTTWASVSKTLTAIGVLKALQATGHSIDDPIEPYLPEGWTINDPDIAQLTFHNLLSEQAFPNGSCVGEDYDHLKTLVEGTSITSYPPPPGVYNNCNFALFRLLLPILVDGGAAFTGPSAPNTLAQRYVALMRQYVFSPLGIDQASCGSDAPDPSRRILSYPFPPDFVAGQQWGPDQTLACGGRGWYLSPTSLFAVISDLTTGNVLLSNNQKQLMFQDWLGWDDAVRSDCPSPDACKNGALFQNNTPPGFVIPTPATNLWSYVGIFKCAIPVVVLVNSPLPPTYQPWTDFGIPFVPPRTDIIGLVDQAYMVTNKLPGQVRLCPWTTFRVRGGPRPGG